MEINGKGRECRNRNWPCFHGAKVEQTERGRVLTDREEECPAINNHKKRIYKNLHFKPTRWHLKKSIFMNAGERHTPCGVYPLILSHIHLHLKVFVQDVLLLFFSTYCRLLLRNKLSGNPLSRWVITVAGQSDFMAADWKMALCSASIYIGKCWWSAITNAVSDGAALPLSLPDTWS